MSMTTGLWNLLPELGRDLGGVDHGLGIVAVDVEDRRLDHLGDVGGVGRGARVARIGGEADLVVDDEVQRAAGAVAVQARQAEALGDDALAGEGGVAVEQERQHAGALVERHDVAARLRRAGPAWRAPCRAPPGRRSRGATGWRSATGGPCCRRTRGPSEAPRWYLTSPEPSTSSGEAEPPLNSWKIDP